MFAAGRVPYETSEHRCEQELTSIKDKTASAQTNQLLCAVQTRWKRQTDPPMNTSHSSHSIVIVLPHLTILTPWEREEGAGWRWNQWEKGGALSTVHVSVAWKERDSDSDSFIQFIQSVSVNQFQSEDSQGQREERAQSVRASHLQNCLNE